MAAVPAAGLVAPAYEAAGYVVPGPDPDVTYLAHHALVIAIPFVFPVLIVVAMVAVIAYRDRHRTDDDELDEQEPGTPTGAGVRKEGEPG
jgi:hypothetical protein